MTTANSGSAMTFGIRSWARTRRDEAIEWNGLSADEQVTIALDPRPEMTGMLFRALASAQLASALGRLSDRVRGRGR